VYYPLTPDMSKQGSNFCPAPNGPRLQLPPVSPLQNFLSNFGSIILKKIFYLIKSFDVSIHIF